MLISIAWAIATAVMIALGFFIGYVVLRFLIEVPTFLNRIHLSLELMRTSTRANVTPSGHDEITPLSLTD